MKALTGNYSKEGNVIDEMERHIEKIRGEYEDRTPEYMTAVSLSWWCGLKEYSKIGDFGCGEMYLARYLGDIKFKNYYFGFDSLPEITIRRKLDLDQLPLKIEDGSLDWGFAIEVMEHLKNPEATCRELMRICKNLTICCPTIKSKTKNYHEDPGHISEISVDRIEKIGFEKIWMIDSYKSHIPKIVDSEEKANILIAVYHNNSEKVLIDTPLEKG